MRRLPFVILPLILIPLMSLGIGAFLSSRNLMEDQAASQMVSAAQAQVQVLQEWTDISEQRLQLGSQRTTLRDAASELLRLPASSSSYRAAQSSARTELEDLRVRQGQVLFSDVLLARSSDGTVLASTNPDWEGQASPFLTPDAVDPSSLATYPFYNDPLFAPDNLVLISSAPLRASGAQEGDLLLIGVNRDTRLGILLEEMQIFWEQRGVYRVERGRTFVLLTPDVVIELPRYATEPEAISGQSHPVFTSAGVSPSGTVEYTNNEGDLVLAAYEWIPGWDLGIVTELPQADIFAEANALAPTAISLLVGAIALVALVVPLATRRAISPLASLTELAQNFSMGDLSARITEVRGDEIGQLSRTFNQMAEDLSDLYRSLEKRVEDRTRQIQTASEVARDAVAIRDVESLLNETVNLITSRFGFYQAGVFLLDRDRENAVMRAASSEGGRRMIANGFSLPVGKVGIVGYTTGTGKPRIALDVGEDQVHFANPDLPETRSEMALPLWAGDQIIGALDVQSKDPNAFDNEDILVLQTMADQLAVAIENARLIGELTELSSQNRRVIEVFTSISEQTDYDTLLAKSCESIREIFGFNRVVIGLVEGNEIVVRSASVAEGIQPTPTGIPIPFERGPLGRAVLTTKPVSALSEDSPGTSQTIRSASTTVAVPLISRGEAIGAIAVESDDIEGLDSRDIETLELIANQVSVALESARLFEETQRSFEQIDSLYRRQTAESWEELLQLIEDDKQATFAEFTSPRYPGAVTDGGDHLDAQISVRGEIVGHLGLLAERPGEWTEDDREILKAVADEVANALEQMRLLEEVQRRAAQLQTAAEVARDATGLLDVETLLNRVVRLISDRFGYPHVAAFLLDKTQKIAEVRAATGEAGAQMLSAGYQLLVGSKTIIGFVIENGEHYLAADVNLDELHQPHPLLTNMRSELSIPLIVGEQVIGALDVQHTNTNAFSLDDIAVLQILTDQLAVAIQNARLFQETLRRVEREQTVLELTDVIRSSDDVEGMLQTAVQEMRRVFGAERSRIRLLDQSITMSSQEQADRQDKNRSGSTPD
jgi:GAF domain-containing protein/HAMP domain-containing protein